MNKLKQKMKAVGVTAYRLSKLSGVSQATISRILNNDKYNPTMRTWEKLNETLKCQITKNK